MTTVEEHEPGEEAQSPDVAPRPVARRGRFPSIIVYTFLGFGIGNWLVLSASGEALNEMLDLVRSEHSLLPLFYRVREVMLHSTFQFGQIALFLGVLALHAYLPADSKTLKAVRWTYFLVYLFVSLAVWTILALIISHIKSS